MRKIWAFIWHQNSTTSGLALGDENAMGTYHFKFFVWVTFVDESKLFVTSFNWIVEFQYQTLHGLPCWPVCSQETFQMKHSSSLTPNLDTQFDHRPSRHGRSSSAKHKRNLVMIWNHVCLSPPVGLVSLNRVGFDIYAPIQKSITNR